MHVKVRLRERGKKTWPFTRVVLSSSSSYLEPEVFQGFILLTTDKSKQDHLQALLPKLFFFSPKKVSQCTIDLE